MELDKADKIILTNLEFNARIKEKDLAKLCHLSKDTIRYRIKKLERNNIIVGYSALIDYTKLGKESYKLYLKIQGPEREWERFRKFLDSKPSIFVRFESQTDWNFAIAYFARSIQEYYIFERELFTHFGGIIQNSQLCHMVDAKIFEPRIMLERKDMEFDIFGEVREAVIDQTDRSILENVLKNSTQPLIELADKIKLSPDATKKRMLRLEKDQVIRRYTTQINYPLLGFETYKVFIFVNEYTEDVEKKILAKLAGYNNTRNIIRMVGAWKIEVEFICKTYNEFFNILKEIRSSFPDNITSINYGIFRNEVYYPSKKIAI